MMVARPHTSWADIKLTPAKMALLEVASVSTPTRVLKLDRAGRLAAARHIAEGDSGRLEIQFSQNVDQWLLDVSTDINIERTPQYGR